MRELVLVVICLVGCGGGGSMSIDELGDEYTDAYCDRLVACGLLESRDVCATLDLDLDIDPDLVAAVHEGKVKFHGDKARACLDALLPDSCDRTELFTSRAEPIECSQMLEGTVGDGGTCAFDEECISQVCDNVTCPPGGGCCSGTCVGATAPVRPHVGEACDATNSTGSCIDSFCDGTTCQPLVAEGGACSSSSQCVPGTACGSSQTCTKPVPPGGACTLSGDCRDINTYCSPTSHTCAAAGLGGDACDAMTLCSPIYDCDATNHCVLGPRLGESCAEKDCIDHSYCEQTTQTCTALKADGSTCAGDSECQSNFCDTSGTCMTPLVCD